MTQQDNKLNQLVTKNLDLHGRRVVGASASVDKDDYVTQGELNSAISSIPTQTNIFTVAMRFLRGLVTSIIAPLVDSTLAVRITKADMNTNLIVFDTTTPAISVTPILAPLVDSTTGVRVTQADKSTNIVVIDTTNKRVGVGTTPIAKFEVTDGYIRALNGTNTAPASGSGVEIVCTGSVGFIIAFDRTGVARLPLTIKGSDITIDNLKLAFWNGTPVVQQTLSAYTTNSQSSAYSGINNAQAGTVYAQLTDLNALRTAYENMRAMVDDLRTKIKTTTLVG